MCMCMLCSTRRRGTLLPHFALLCFLNDTLVSRSPCAHITRHWHHSHHQGQKLGDYLIAKPRDDSLLFLVLQLTWVHKRMHMGMHERSA